MKTIIKACAIVSLGGLLRIAAQETSTETKTEVTEHPGGAVTQKETTTTTTFNPEARTKVVKYFDTYKGNPHGLPPGWVAKIKVKELPSNWRSGRIAPGVVVAETERSYLVDAPQDLLDVLPAPTSGVRYYVAGSNVIAVDSSYKIVDSIQIPSINFTTTTTTTKE